MNTTPQKNAKKIYAVFDKPFVSPKMTTPQKIVECPVCGFLSHSGGLKQHITLLARKEALDWYLAGESIPTPHTNHYQDNYHIKHD